MREVSEQAMSGKTPCVAGVPAGATVAPSDRVDGDGWETEGGGRCVQRATIERAKGGRR